MGEPSPAFVLETEALCRNFGGLAAVRDVSLSLRHGELHAVIGPNGAGKSTLANLLAGELPPTSGRIRLMGDDVTGLPVWRMAHAGIGRSFQRTNIFAPLTVLTAFMAAARAPDIDHLGFGQLCRRNRSLG